MRNKSKQSRKAEEIIIKYIIERYLLASQSGFKEPSIGVGTIYLDCASQLQQIFELYNKKLKKKICQILRQSKQLYSSRGIDEQSGRICLVYEPCTNLVNIL